MNEFPFALDEYQSLQNDYRRHVQELQEETDTDHQEETVFLLCRGQTATQAPKTSIA